ncbi:MAG: hypothetical protein WCG25_06925 [bacterium]
MYATQASNTATIVHVVFIFPLNISYVSYRCILDNARRLPEYGSLNDIDIVE